jgi:hypothetical protein
MPRLETVQESQPGAVTTTGHRNGGPGIGSYVGTVALVGLGIAFIEEELLAGMAIGVAAMAFPNLVPRLGSVFRPALKSAVRAGYGLAARTRETVAEMSEEFQDVLAEVRAEQEHGTEWEGATREQKAETAAPNVTEQAGEPERGKARKSAKASAEGQDVQQPS